MTRNYKKETAYEDSPEQVHRRVQRNAARRKAIKTGKVHKGDNREIDHIGRNRKGPLNNKKVRVVTRAKNRRKQPKRDGSQD